MDFLKLPDEKLTSIFVALRGGHLRDFFYVKDVNGTLVSTPGLTPSLAMCSSRLNLVYRESIESLGLTKSYSTSHCQRILSRFPRIKSLSVDLVYADETDDSEMPDLSPSCLVTRRMNSIDLQNCSIQHLEFKAMVEKCSELKSLSLNRVRIIVDSASLDYEGEACTLSLENHASSLTQLHIESCVESFDVTWLVLPRLSALRTLWLSKDSVRNFHAGVLGQLENAKDLNTLDLINFLLSDDNLISALTFHPHLGSLGVVNSENLSWRFLESLPKRMNRLDISFSDGVLESFPLIGGNWRNEPKVLKSLWAAGTKYPKFKYFLDVFAGSSIESLDLTNCQFERESDLMYLLERTPSLIQLDVTHVTFTSAIHDDIFERIAMTTGLTNDGNGIFTK